MGNGLNLKESRKLVHRFSLPTRPLVMLEAVKAQSAFVPNPVAVTEIILRDMALSAQILQAANTLLTGYNRKVESIECAMALLGQEKLRDITQELFLSGGLARKASWMQTMRTRSVRAARILSWLARELRPLSPHFRNGNLPVVPPDEAYSVGLFHDCGQLVLLRQFADYPELLTADRQATQQTLAAAEAERYQTTHALLGSLLCDAWQLPKPWVYVVAAHHQPDAFAGRPVRERKYAVLHAMLLMTEWIEGDLLDWEWEPGWAYIQPLFALDDAQIVSLRERALERFPLAGAYGE
ncbi:MAG: HDOD domain-containing protein [Magnetococcales bacterium]|nr:HDOD domain-containing protein [Magnetococcales bacterium]